MEDTLRSAEMAVREQERLYTNVSSEARLLEQSLELGIAGPHADRDRARLEEVLGVQEREGIELQRVLDVSDPT